MAHLFSFQTLQQPRAPRTADEAAMQMATEAIEAIKERRQLANEREIACEPSLEWSPEDQEQRDVLEALLKGRHRPVVLPLILEAFPELLAKLPQA